MTSRSSSERSMLVKNKFIVFILTHGRSDKVITEKSLRKSGYSGRIVYIVDDEDKTLDLYLAKFGEENVYVFDKKAYADAIDEGNNFDDRRAIIHARNACFDAAKDLGYTYFIQLDDDYTAFDYRIDIDGGVVKPIKNIDAIFDKMFDFYRSTSCKAIAFSQGGDFIGGLNNGKQSYRFNKRKCMNSFFCSTERAFRFFGAINEDVNAYTLLASRGDIFLTIPFLSLTQKTTQSQNSGMTDWYAKFGTYCKSFTTTLYMPSAVKVKMLNASKKRLHHSICWKSVTPQIISERHKKPSLVE
jgi:hypothetical protein